MRTNLRRLLLSSVPFAAMLVIACDKPSSGDGPAGSASAPIAAPSASTSASAVASASAAPSSSAMTKPPGERRGGGLATMFIRGARELPDLKDPQKATLTKIEDGLKDGTGGGDGGAGAGNGGGGTGMMSEYKAIHEELIAGVKAGKIDMTKMQAHYAVIDKAAQAKQDKEVEALNGIYAALEPAQRKTVAAGIRTRMSAHDDDKKMPTMPDGGAADWTKRRLERMTKDLALDDAQQKSVSAVLAKGPSPATMETMRADAKKRSEALLAAFEKDTGFDAKKLDLSMMPGKKAHDMLDQHVQFVSQMLAILKADQRDKFAATMERPPMGGPGGMGGMGGRPDMMDRGGPGGMGAPFAHGPHDDD